MTNIIATIGPSSDSDNILSYFSKNGVDICRLNVVHNTSQWHSTTSKKIKERGMQVMFDLAGPKNLIHNSQETITLNSDELVYVSIHSEPIDKSSNASSKCIYTEDDFTNISEVGDILLIDDGKVHLKIYSVRDSVLECRVKNPGIILPGKGVTINGKSFNKPVLTKIDKNYLDANLVSVKPEWIAVSYVKTSKDIVEVRRYIQEVLKNNDLDYSPKICVKVETEQASKDMNSLLDIYEAADMLMVARGDLSIESKPIYIKTALIQDQIAHISKKIKKPFVVATGILESMSHSQKPSISEISDLYRVIHINEADYLMFSAETAVGKNPKEVVDMVSKCRKLI